jgi:hypothetical protein
VALALCEAKKANGFMRGGVSGMRHQTPKLAAALSLSLSSEHGFLLGVAGNAACLNEQSNEPDEEEQAVQAQLLRDIFGNPFRPGAVDPSWLTHRRCSRKSDVRKPRFLPRADPCRRTSRR